MNKINFIPQGDRILIKPDAPETVTKSGLIIPDTARERSLKGTIVAVGVGKSSKELMTSKVGDCVVYGKHSGAPLVIEDEEYLIMRQDDVLGTFF